MRDLRTRLNLHPFRSRSLRRRIAQWTFANPPRVGVPSRTDGAS